MLSLFGTSPRMLMLGFMLPTMFLSMWISNTATSVLMIPILEVMRMMRMMMRRRMMIMMTLKPVSLCRPCCQRSERMRM